MPDRRSDSVSGGAVAVARSGLVRQLATVAGSGLLALIALSFYSDTIVHFADYTEENFGRFWPRRFWLLGHLLGGTLALFSGPFQLWSGLRGRYYEIHRWTGRLYVTGVLIGGTSAFYLALHAQPTGFGVALFALGVAWWGTVGMAIYAIKQGHVEAHKTWMIRGYVVTFAFVTFRWLLGLPIWSFLGSSQLAVIAWLSWVLPLFVTEMVFRWTRTARPSIRPASSATG